MERFLIALMARGPTVLVAGVVLGLAWPALADLARPAMASAIFVLLMTTLLRVELPEAGETLRRPYHLAILLVVALIGCPISPTLLPRPSVFRPT